MAGTTIALLNKSPLAKLANPASQQLAAAARALSEAHKALVLANATPDASMVALEQSNQKLETQVAKLTVSLDQERARTETLVEEMRKENEELRKEVEALKNKEHEKETELAQRQDVDEAERREMVMQLDDQTAEIHARTAALRAAMAKLSAPKASRGNVAAGSKRKAAQTGRHEDIAEMLAYSNPLPRVLPLKRQRVDTHKFSSFVKRGNSGNSVRHTGLLGS
ncbi:hypothetical protein R3P38DRAFT_3228691 [Favolaschia claudopus]|uniref:Uncharacterized protein n=1 Tax=Favolaschia claudopus TaxID=2862362 RepID=A0AAV9ZRK7_9AGAR